MRHMAAMRANLAAMGQMAAQGFVSSALGLVTSYDPDHYAVKVQLQPPPAEGEAAETGWLPVWSPWIGQSWGFFSPPNVGDQVLVLFPGGDGQIGLVVGGIFSDLDKPLPVPAKEFWLQQEKGAFVKLTADGKLTLNDGHGASVVLSGDGKIASAGAWTHTGTFHATGAATLDSTLAVTGKTTAAEIDSSGPIKVGGTPLTVP